MAQASIQTTLQANHVRPTSLYHPHTSYKQTHYNHALGDDKLTMHHKTIGRGVFAKTSIPARTILDVTPVLVLDPEEVEAHVKYTKFWFYTL